MLSDININIKKNEIVGLLGANGSGKTTFIKVLLGLISPKNLSKDTELLIKS